MAKIDSNVLEREVRALIAEIAEIEPEKITMDASFVEDLSMDSMMALEILASIEKKYKLKIPEDNLTKMTSLKQVLGLVESIMK